MLNAFTIDLEDWIQSTYDNSRSITHFVHDNTIKLLELLDDKNTKATFFVLGLVAEAYPDLIREVHKRGHEIASHGYGHKLVFTQSPEEFKDDIKHSIDTVGSITNSKILGYRAPDFSIISESLWALEILDELGIKYDSSIYPIKNPRYGIPGWPREPKKVDNSDLIEFPISTITLFDINLPFVGGGYTRLLPYPVMAFGIRHLNANGMPVNLYMHPYELNDSELKRLDIDISFKQMLSQGLNRKKVYSRISTLLTQFTFGTITEALQNMRLL
ncbi:DUF3473 domain-containing protein [candidate division KSB1 bacterium]|nr:DUF3473 domain-containing protein [candidate division KSB1 bacterium]